MNKKFLIILITLIFAFFGAALIVIKFFEKNKFKNSEFYEEEKNKNSKKNDRKKEKEKNVNVDEEYWGKYFVEE